MLICRWRPLSDTDWIPPFGDELEKHVNRYKGGVRKASCSAWGLLYEIIIENSLPYGTVEFTKSGKPYFKNCETFFSLSHSKDLCAAAVSDSSVGIDIECDRGNVSQKMIDRTLSCEEKVLFDGDFTKLWCRKEAIAKLTGEGIIRWPSEINTLRPDVEIREEMIIRQNIRSCMAAAYFKNI